MVDPETVSDIRVRASTRLTCMFSGMADRGMGIRLFNSKNSLKHIFDDFEDADDAASDTDKAGTSVVTSQLRHFVVQVVPRNHAFVSPYFFET